MLAFQEQLQAVSVLVRYQREAYVRIVWYDNVSYVKGFEGARYVNFRHCEFQVSNTSWQSNKSFACTQDSVPDDLKLLPDVLSRLKSNLCQICDFDYEISFLSCLLLPFVQFWMVIHKLFSNILLIQTYHTTYISFSCQFMCVPQYKVVAFKRNTFQCEVHEKSQLND